MKYQCGIVGSRKDNDPIFNRLSSAIREAVKTTGGDSDPLFCETAVGIYVESKLIAVVVGGTVYYCKHMTLDLVGMLDDEIERS